MTTRTRLTTVGTVREERSLLFTVADDDVAFPTTTTRSSVGSDDRAVGRFRDESYGRRAAV